MMKVGDRVIVTKSLTKIKDKPGYIEEVRMKNINDPYPTSNIFKVTPELSEKFNSVYFYRVRFDDKDGCNVFVDHPGDIIILDVERNRDIKLEKLGI